MTGLDVAAQVRLLGQQTIERQWALATVFSGHAGGAVNPRLVFDGESSAGAKAYPRLLNVAAGNRVLCARAGSTWVVVGVIL